jgi:hypothetical protein
MESGKADFHPHQFRPVLKFVESTGRRILIADEVGLGKTILQSTFGRNCKRAAMLGDCWSYVLPR